MKAFVCSLLSLSLFAAAPLAGEAGLERFRFTEPHMGTRVTITVYAPGERDARAGADRAFSRIRELNAVLSDYDDQSELMRLSRQPPGIPVPAGDDLLAVLARAEAVSAMTGGAFDITVGPLVHLWRETRASGTLPDPEALERARKATGYRKLRIDREAGTVTLLAEGMRLDPGGIGKGYAADAALAVLRKAGLPRALVAVGGDLALGDPPPGAAGWRVGIAPDGDAGNPDISPRILANTAVSTSGDAEQYVEIDGIRYSHILDPRTGLGLTERIAVTVIAPDATTADALATAISVMGPLDGLALVESLPKVEALIRQPGEPHPVVYGNAAMPDARQLVILHINDTHGRLLPYKTDRGEDVGGIARLATLVDSIRRENEGRILLLHAGDIFSQGDPITVHYGGYVNFLLMEKIGFDALTPGNGEFYFGIENLQEQAARVRFPLIHANGVYKNHGGSIFPPYVIKEVDGIRVGILGLGVIRMWPPSTYTLEMRDPIETARHYVPRLQEKTDLVIALTHIGTPADKELAAEVPGIDLVIGGHTHTPLFEPLRIPREDRSGEVIIGNAGGYMRALGRLDLNLEATDDGFHIIGVEGELLPVDGAIGKDREVVRILEKFGRRLDEGIFYAQEPIGNPSSGESPMGDLVAAAMLAETRAAMAILDRTAVRAGIEAGEMTLADLYRVHPWRNRVVILRLTGAEIEELLSEHDLLTAGCRFTRTEEGIEGLYIGGKPVESDREYRVAAGEFFTRLIDVPRAGLPEATGLRVNTALERYLRRNGPDS